LQCAANRLRKKINPSDFITGGPPARHSERRNPRFEALLDSPIAKSSGHPVLIKNATVWDGTGNQFVSDLLLRNGLIERLAHDISVQDYQDDDDMDRVEVVDAQGRVVTPGLVDQHSHVGTDSFPRLIATSDTNEYNYPLNPQLRIIDSISPLDPAFDIVVSGGVTTSMVLPGSGLLMGGEGLVVKMLKPGTALVEEMQINYGMSRTGMDGRMWRWMKMACGENPKTMGRYTHQMPTSRMGSGWMFRKQFEQAQRVLQEQDDWCVRAEVATSLFKDKAHLHVSSRYPEPLMDESLVMLLRGDVRLQVHCYEPNDMEMMVRNKNEFDFKIVAFHHATEAHMIAPLLAKENISAAIFA
jgi:imidazolonepropionase-like amidohydrolase